MGMGDGDGDGDDPGDGANGEGWEAISEIGMYGRQARQGNLGDAIWVRQSREWNFACGFQ